MAKKKKALKPVARGFATVSVPKKPQPSEQPQDTAENAGDPPGARSSDTPAVLVTPPQTDLAILEEVALQAIVEKFQDKTEKDIVRGVKVGYSICQTNKSSETFRSRQAIEQDRRFAQTFPMLTLDPVVTDRILELALEGEKIEGEHARSGPLEAPPKFKHNQIENSVKITKRRYSVGSE